LAVASPEFKADRQLVYAAAKYDDRALQYADQHLQHDRAFVLQVVKRRGTALLGVLPKFRRDREIASEAVRQDRNALQYVEEALRREIIQ